MTVLIQVIVCVPGEHADPPSICIVNDGWFRLGDTTSRLINVGRKVVDAATAYSMGKLQKWSLIAQF